tara:strand:+ start:377 stop:589 length:213 start_codon:yes stop_codon:yes gene_type:complete
MTKKQNGPMMMTIINTLGDGDHPFADETTIKHFTLEYKTECCNRALKSGLLSDEGEDLTLSILAELEEEE